MTSRWSRGMMIFCLLLAGLSFNSSLWANAQEDAKQSSIARRGSGALQIPSSTTSLRTAPLRTTPARYLSPNALESPVDDESYVLGPHDLLNILIQVGSVRNERVPVLPEGIVLVPNVGAIPAAGKTLSEFRRDLQEAVAQKYQNFQLYCHLLEARQFRVYVTGAVKDPGTVLARPYDRVSDLIERAGGLAENASRRHLQLKDISGAVLQRVDLGAFYARGEMQANPRVTEGYVVFVPIRTRTVRIWGAVGAPGLYEHRHGDRISDLLALAGGPMPSADLQQITIDYQDKSGEVKVQQVDLQASPQHLEDAIRLTVSSKMLGRQRAFVLLPDHTRLTFYLPAGGRLRELVARVPSLPEEVDLTAGVLVSRDAKGKSNRTSVDLTAMDTDASNPILLDGDLLSLTSVRDYVYVSGFVASPGRFSYRGEWTVNDYVGEAGGTTSGGNLSKAIIMTPEGSTYGVGRGAAVEPGSTIFVDRSLGGKIANGLAIIGNFSALVISVIALTN